MALSFMVESQITFFLWINLSSPGVSLALFLRSKALGLLVEGGQHARIQATLPHMTHFLLLVYD